MRLFHLLATAFVLAAMGTSSTAAERLIGMKLDEAKKTDFFTFFRLLQTDAGTDDTKRTVLTFRPENKEFGKLVQVRVTLAADETLLGMEVAMDRKFVDDRLNGLFARDISKSLLRGSLSNVDEKQMSKFLTEVESVDVEPNEKQSDAYRTYLGKRESYDQALESAKVELMNVKRAERVQLLIRVKRK